MACFQTSCGRDVTLQEVSDAFVACKAVCTGVGDDTRAASILQLQRSSCTAVSAGGGVVMRECMVAMSMAGQTTLVCDA